MGFSGESAIANHPIPLLASPLKGEELIVQEPNRTMLAILGLRGHQEKKLLSAASDVFVEKGLEP